MFTPCFWVTIDSPCPYVLKMISSWVRKFLGIAKAHKSHGTFQDAALSEVLVACVILVSILKPGNWARVTTLFSCIKKIVESCGYGVLSGLAFQNYSSNCSANTTQTIGEF